MCVREREREKREEREREKREERRERERCFICYCGERSRKFLCGGGGGPAHIIRTPNRNKHRHNLSFRFTEWCVCVACVIVCVPTAPTVDNRRALLRLTSPNNRLCSTAGCALHSRLRSHQRQAPLHPPTHFPLHKQEGFLKHLLNTRDVGWPQGWGSRWSVWACFE